MKNRSTPSATVVPILVIVCYFITGTLSGRYPKSR